MSTAKLRTVFAFLLCSLLAVAPLAAQEDAAGAITGTVLDGGGNPLPGARVTVDGTGIAAVTSVEGTFRLPRVPVGAQTLTATYLGLDDATATVTVPAGNAVRVELTLKAPGASDAFAETITVRSEPILEGQAKALNQQKNAINIKNIIAADQIGRFPDPNAAEATQRVPGVTLQRDQGEGRYILVRGTEARLNSTTINGQRIPSPEGDVRNVALDVVPADLLEAIEVSKALTPDMDGDAIGGAVDLITRRAPQQRRIGITAGTGYNDQSEDGLVTGGFTYGGRTGDGRLGLLLSGSFLDTDRGTDNFEVEYDDGFLEELELRDYSVNRQRTGLTADLDYRASDSSELTLRGIFNEFDDQEFRRRLRNQVGDDELERELKDRFESQEITSLAFAGSHLFAGSTLLEYRVAYSEASEDEPGRLDSTFKQEDVEFDANVVPGTIDRNNIRANPLNQDLDAFVLDDIVAEDNLTEEEDLVLAVDLTLPLRFGDRYGRWKFGAKRTDKEKFRDNNVVAFESDDDLFLSAFLDGFNAAPFFSDRYTLGPFQSASAMRALLPQLESERDFEEDLADYTAEEETIGLYGLAEVALTDRLTLLAGARWETTDIAYEAFEILFDEEGDFAALTPLAGSNDFSEFLPMVHLRYAVDDRSNVRFALTRSLARPNYEDLAPSQLILEEDFEIERGNPDLVPTTAWNVDLLWERYLSSVGVISAGVFYKELSDNIFPFVFDEVRNGEDFEVIQPRNGGDAEVLGLEFAYQNQLRFLPAPFDGLGVYFNYTFTDSDAEFPGREDATLQGQSENLGNLALSYERAGFSGRLSWNFHDDYLFEVGDEAAEDTFIAGRSQLDLSLSQRITSRVRLFVELNNLTDEPFRVYEGSSDRTIQEERYSWWGTVGVKLDF